MDNERAKFQQVFTMPRDVYWSADSRKYKAKTPDASFIVVMYGTKWDAWQACAQNKQREIDALSAQLAESDAALAESRENDMESMRQCHELAAQVERLQVLLRECTGQAGLDNALYKKIRKALSATPSAALREVKARTLEEAADNWTGFIQIESGDETAAQLREMAAAIRKGE